MGHLLTTESQVISVCILFSEWKEGSYFQEYPISLKDRLQRGVSRVSPTQGGL